MRLLKRGAEADVYEAAWRGAPAILKVRRPRAYRHPELDARIRRQRTAREAQALCRAKGLGVPAPLVRLVDPACSSILMQRVPGVPVHGLPGPRIAALSRQMGRLAGLLHRGGMMHGDLTTSNYVAHRGGLFLVDFGLSQATVRPEDHAVDLRLIREILNSAHARVMERGWAGFVAGYRRAVGPQRCSRILDLVAEIEGRGRYATVV